MSCVNFWKAGEAHREAGVAAGQQAALCVLELAEGVVHSASEVTVEVAVRGADVVVAGRVCELQPARPASHSLHELPKCSAPHC